MRRIGLFLIFIVLTGLFTACENHDLAEGNTVRVVVVETADVACGLPVVRMLSTSGAPPTSFNDPIYSAYNLDASLNVKGAELIVVFQQVPGDKLQPCLAVGTWYQSIWIKSAKRLK
jgi:hypothetical protein